MKKLIFLTALLLFCNLLILQAQDCSVHKVKKGQKKAAYGKYTEEGAVYAHPYTIFDQGNKSVEDLQKQVKGVKEKIINHPDELLFYFIYKDTH